MLRIEVKIILGVGISRTSAKDFGCQRVAGKMCLSKGVDIVPGEPVRNGLLNSSVLQNGQQLYFGKDIPYWFCSHTSQ